VRPKTPFGQKEQEEDANALHSAMKGLGTDEKIIVNILANRTNGQRQIIAHRFESLFGKVIYTSKKHLSADIIRQFYRTGREIISANMRLDKWCFNLWLENGLKCFSLLFYIFCNVLPN